MGLQRDFRLPKFFYVALAVEQNHSHLGRIALFFRGVFFYVCEIYFLFLAVKATFLLPTLCSQVLYYELAAFFLRGPDVALYLKVSHR